MLDVQFLNLTGIIANEAKLIQPFPDYVIHVLLDISFIKLLPEFVRETESCLCDVVIRFR